MQQILPQGIIQAPDSGNIAAQPFQEKKRERQHRQVGQERGPGVSRLHGLFRAEAHTAHAAFAFVGPKGAGIFLPPHDDRTDRAVPGADFTAVAFRVGEEDLGQEKPPHCHVGQGNRQEQKPKKKGDDVSGRPPVGFSRQDSSGEGGEPGAGPGDDGFHVPGLEPGVEGDPVHGHIQGKYAPDRKTAEGKKQGNDKGGGGRKAGDKNGPELHAPLGGEGESGNSRASGQGEDEFKHGPGGDETVGGCHDPDQLIFILADFLGGAGGVERNHPGGDPPGPGLLREPGRGAEGIARAADEINCYLLVHGFIIIIISIKNK